MSLYKKLFDEYVWGLKYRPNNLDDVILPARIKTQISNIIQTGDIPNLLMFGPPGLGKTTTAAIIADTLNREALYVNGSTETSVSIMRSKILDFVAAMSWDGCKKIVIMDEFDRASPQLQDAFKVVIEEFSKSCGFIIISNHKNRIIGPLQSRLQAIDYTFTKNETTELIKAFFKRACHILDNEGATYDQKVVAHIVKSCFPDMRKILNELQKFNQQGALTDITVVKGNMADTDEYYKILRSKDFQDMRGYIERLSSDAQTFYGQIYDTFPRYVEPESYADVTLMLGKYSFEAASVADQRINMASFSTDLILNVTFKKDF